MKRLRGALLAGIAVSAILLAVLVARLDWPEFAAAIRQVSGIWLLAAAVTVFGSVSMRALRWQLVVGLPAGQFVGVWHANVFGIVGNIIYPGRAGEVLRIAALHRIAHVPPGRALASAFADRLGDVVVLALAAVAVASIVAGLPGTVVAAAVGLAIVLLAAFAAFLAFGSSFAPSLSRVAGWLPRSLAERVPRWYAQAHDHARALRRPGILAGALALSFAAFAWDYAIIWFVFQAMGWSLPLAAAVAVAVLIALGTLLPAAPGYIGIYQVACVLALHPFGIAESPALAFSVIVQVTTFTVLGLLGLTAFAHFGWALRPAGDRPALLSQMRLLRFGTLTGMTWLTDFAIFAVLVAAGIGPAAANAVSAGSMALLVYFMSVRHVFREHRGRHTINVTVYLAYLAFAVTLFSWCIGWLAGQGVAPWLGKILVVPLQFYAHFQVMSLLLTRRLRWM